MQASKTMGTNPGAIYWILAFLAWVLVPYVGEISLWLLLCFASIAVWRILILRLGWYQPGTSARAIMAVLMFIVVYKTEGGIFGRDAGMALLIVMVSLKLLELNNQRDAIIATLLGFILILGNFLYSQSLLLAIYSLLGVVIGFACLYRANFDESVPISDRFRLAAQLIIISLPLMLALYFLFPRLPGGLFGLPGTSGGTTGLSEDMSPGSINSLSQSDKPAFHAAFQNQQQVSGPFYWRAIILWGFDGRTWHRNPPNVYATYNITALAEPLEYEIVMQQSARWIPSLDVAVKGPANARLMPGMVYRWSRRETNRRRYRLTSIPKYTSKDLFRAEYNAALQLPATSERVKQLAQQWRQQSGSNKDIVNAALRYFRQQEFYYTLKPPLLGGDPVDEFLFERRQGFCEHFSSAFVVLMRQAGVPARVVTGFLGAEFNITGGFYTVRQSDAHAWAEVWLKDNGWTRVDPTNAVAPERIQYSMAAFRRMQQQGLDPEQTTGQQLSALIQGSFFDRLLMGLRQQWDIMNVNWYRWTTGFDTQRQQELLKSLDLHWPRWLTHAVALLAAIFIPVMLVMFVLLRRPNKRTPLARLYEKFCQLFNRSGVERQHYEGPVDYGERLCGRFPELSTDIDKFVVSYVYNYYGDRSGDINSLAKQLKLLRTKLRSNK